ncbi:hypothetical protein [Curtobacterium sp. MCBD17_040]|nr:hypothetical protein [Curtobacterium sp. MCBD17_040]WIB65842.1 hypothetical protein DEI94_17155 [Curtobacterium sp. MCBD17_040]
MGGFTFRADARGDRALVPLPGRGGVGASLTVLDLRLMLEQLERRAV